MKPTIYDVAKLAGVSSTMASRILRGARKRQDVMTLQVREAAAILGYQPNRMAQSLRSTSSRVIGLVVPEFRNPFFSAYAELLSRRAMDNNYVVMSLVATKQDILPVVQRLAEYRVRAVVSAVPEVTDAMQRVNWDGLLIAVSRQPAQSKVPYVGMDDYEAGKLLGQHLAALGHRRVLVEVESLEIPSTRPRIQGLKDSLASDDIFIDTLNHPDEVTVSRIDSLVRHTHATAVAGGSDAIALRLYSALGQIGLRIPADVSLVSFDGTFAVEDFVPIPLTSVVQPIDQCVATVMEWINNDLTRDDVRRATLLTPDLRLGQSTRPITTVKSVNQG